MTRVVFRRLATKKSAAKKAKASQGSVTVKSIHRANGQRVKVLSIDANSPTFTTDLSTVFERNVAKARRENKKRFGSADRVA